MRDDQDYMTAAANAANRSTDRSRKVGCVVVDGHGAVVAVGFNAFPPGVADREARHERPEKYFWTEHAERAAIYGAAKDGVALEGCKMYLPWFPCMDCARAVAMAGIAEIVAVEPDMSDPKWGADFQRVFVFLGEVGVRLRFVAPPKT